jgi:hypothetical protein
MVLQVGLLGRRTATPLKPHEPRVGSGLPSSCDLQTVLPCRLVLPSRVQLFSCKVAGGVLCFCTWAQDERPADLHMAQPNVPLY